MIYEESEKYESRLTALVNTRLLFNTMDELEEVLGNHAIHSNSIKRCYPTPVRLRAAYRDCKVEVALRTNNILDLDELMADYERTWKFYKEHFSRRKNPETIARNLLQCHFDLILGKEVNAAVGRTIRAIRAENVDMALLTLFLLKALPGYNSKSGDATDIERQFDEVIRFLKDFTAGCGIFDVLPVITLANEETDRTRLMLIYHTNCILDTYDNFLDPMSIALTSNSMKEISADLDIAGIWTDNKSTDFWKIEETSNMGVYFATCYHREGKSLLSFTRYTLQLIRGADDKLTAYFLHPVAMRHRLAGKPYGDEDNAWYISDYPASHAPDTITLVRSMQSAHWPYSIDLARATDPSRIDRYDYEINAFAKIDHYEDCRYTFTPSIYAITQDAVYVLDEKDECFYRLPRFTDHEFESLTIDDNVGILEMGTDARYLTIDERLLYIPLTPENLAKYGIEPVTEIDRPACVTKKGYSS